MLSRLMPLVLFMLLATAGVAYAQGPLVVSTWGGNWKDTVEREVGKAFTARTGVPVEFEVGGTIDRLGEGRAPQGSPPGGVPLTTAHVGRLYISDGLFAPLDM